MPNLKITYIREEDGLCQFVYKGLYYTSTPYLNKMRIDCYGFLLFNGKKSSITPEDVNSMDKKGRPVWIDCSIWLEHEYLTYKELYFSIEFEEAIETVFLYRGEYNLLCTSVRGVYKNKLIMDGHYSDMPYVHAVFYKDGQYHYAQTDAFDEVVDYKVFHTQPELWKYVESTPYVSDLIMHHMYEPKWVDGKYVEEKLPFTQQLTEKLSAYKFKYIPPDKPRTEPVAQVVPHPEKDAPAHKSYEYADGIMWVCVKVGSDVQTKYKFSCINCEKEIKLRTSYGRYGYVGPFKCPFCSQKYVAAIDDNNPLPHLYVSGNGKRLNLILEGQELTDAQFRSVSKILDELVPTMTNMGFMRIGTRNLYQAEYCYKSFKEEKDKSTLSFVKNSFAQMAGDDFGDNRINKLINELVAVCEKAEREIENSEN